MTRYTFENKVVFITGSNRGIGKAIIEILIKSKVKKIYAAARDIKNLNFNDSRVVPVQLDITDNQQVQNVTSLAGDTQALINNAGSLALAPIASGRLEDIISDMEVNYFGTVRMIQAFVPILERNKDAAIANFSSIIGLASMAGVGGYCAAKAAVTSATQAIRTELKSKNINVYCIFPGPIETDMAKDFNFSKTSAVVAAENIIAGITEGKEDIFPDPVSQELSQLWFRDPKGFEKRLCAAAYQHP